MRVIDVHAHAIFKETLNSIKGLGPEIGGDQDNPWFRAGDYKLEGVRYEKTPFMDINLRLDAMESLGVDYQVLSPNPITYFHFIESKEAINYCKLHCCPQPHQLLSKNLFRIRCCLYYKAKHLNH